MEVMQIISSQATDVALQEMYVSKGCSEYLKLGCIPYEDKKIQYETLIRYTIDYLCGSVLKIKKVYLGLKIARWSAYKQKDCYTLKVNINEEPFDCTWINSDIKPSSKWYKDVIVTKEQLEIGWIMIDLTELVEWWLKGEVPNYGITLSTEDALGIEIFSNCTGCGPVLTFYGEVSPYVPEVKDTVAIQLQAKNRQTQIIETNKAVQFDAIVAKASEYLDYDFEEDKIIIKKPGWYMIQWWIAIDGSGDIPQISFVLENEDSTIRRESSAPVFVLSQPSGNAIIEIKDTKTKLQLLNRSGAAIQFANVGTQASLVMSKI